MCRTYCPKCDADIENDLYEFWRDQIDFGIKREYECLNCGAKLETYLRIEYEVEEKEQENIFKEMATQEAKPFKPVTS